MIATIYLEKNGDLDAAADLGDDDDEGAEANGEVAEALGEDEVTTAGEATFGDAVEET